MNRLSLVFAVLLIGLVTIFAVCPAEAALIGHWQLDETVNPTGNTSAADTSGNGLNGTYQPLGGPGPIVGLPGATPTTGTAAKFNGNADEIYLGSPAQLKMTNDFTIAAWVNPSRLSGVQRIFSQYSNGGMGYGLGLNGNDLRFTTYSVKDYNTNTINLPLNDWSHIALTFDTNNDATFFVNGQPRQTITGTAPAKTGNNNFFIGSLGTSERLGGMIDDVQIHSGVLSRTDIQQLAGNVLIGHWKLDETANPTGGTTALDSSGNGLVGRYQPNGGPGPIVGQTGAAAQTGTAAAFNGSNDEIFLAKPGDLKMSNNFTVMAWINPDVTSGVQRIFSSDSQPGNGYGFGLSGDELRFTSFSIKDYQTSGVDIPTGTWSHVAAVFDLNNTASFYLDGVLQEAITGVAPAKLASGNFFIGSTGRIERFDGLIDDVRIYTGAMTGQQVYDVYYAAQVPEPSSLVLLAIGVLGLLGLARRKRCGTGQDM